MTRAEWVRARVAATWSARAKAELEAAERFARVGAELRDVGANAGIVKGILSAADDERRHARVCEEVARSFGADAAPVGDVPRTRAGRPEMDLRDQLLWEVVSACCVGETLNVALLTLLKERTKDRTVQRAVHELLKDEVRHSRVGWAHLAAERSIDRGAFLATVLPLILEASVEPGFFDAPVERCADDLRDLGEVSPGEAMTLYCETLTEVVFPGLEAMFVSAEAGREWLERQVPNE